MTAESVETNAKDIRSLRLRKGLGFRALAKLARIEEQRLRKVERGLEPPPIEFFEGLAPILEVSPKALRSAHKSLQASTVPGEGYRTARAVRSFRKERKRPVERIPILDLFCGTGGFSHGFESTRKFQVCCGIDFLPDRVETFASNHPTSHAICNDLRQTSIDDLLHECPTPEVVIGGPPCQGFSSIRPFRRLTECDPRNNLFEEFALVVDACRPKWFVMENVVGMLTNNNGETLETVLSVFRQMRYAVSWRILNAAFYGLPQRRERLFIVGSRDGLDYEWPTPTHFFEQSRTMAGRHGQRVIQNGLFQKEYLPATTVMEAIHDLPELKAGECATSYRLDVRPTQYERSLRGRRKTVTLHEATRHSERMLEIIRHAGTNRAALPEGLTTSGFSTCYSRLEPHQPSVTLTVNFVHPASNKCIHPYQDRALTPREGARLQGFPDSFKFLGTRAQIVKQIGNAVPPLFGRVIADSLLRLLE